MYQETKKYIVAYSGMWIECGKQQVRVFPTLSEAIYYKQWIQSRPWWDECYWIELLAVCMETV